jgi:general secretion pathway protein N
MLQEYKKLLTLAVACFLVFFVTMLPARVVFAVFMPNSVQGFGVEGSIWKGSARIINVAGQQLRNTEWDLALSRLVIGQLGGDFKTRWGSGFAEGFGSISMAGTIRLSDAQASFDVALLNSLLGIPKVGGQISLQIEDLEVIDSWPRRLSGSGEIRNLSSPLMGNGAADLIGNVAVEFDTATETDTQTITGQIYDTGGPLELKGTILLTPPGNYDLSTRLKTRPDAPKVLQQNLQFLGSPESDGSHIFKLAGSI